MKHKLGRSIVVSMVTMLILSIMATLPPVFAQPNIYMTPSVNPPAPGPYVGFKWNITLWITAYGTPPVFAWQVLLTYNGVAAKINATRAWNAIGDPAYIFTGRGTVNPPPSITPQISVLVGDSLLGGNGETPPPDPAKLAIIEFEILGAPAKYETLSTPLTIDHGVDTYLLDDTLSTIPRTATDGSYSWVWQAPTTNPHFEVVPSSVVYDMFTPANGSTFDVDVVLANLDVGWAVTSANFTLKFNTTIIDTSVVDITINTADWDAYTVNVIHPLDPFDKIEVNVTTTQSLSGDVLIATITFTVQDIQQTNPPYTDPQISPLDIQDEFVYDHAGLIQTEPAVDGEVEIHPLATIPFPWLEVEFVDTGTNETVLNPEGELIIGEQFGKEFCVNVNIKSLHKLWEVVGVQFRLSYDPSLLMVTSITEGPYMESFPNRDTPPLTWFYGAVEPGSVLYPEHVLVGVLILPNATGDWNNTAGGIWAPGDPVPEEANGTLATICFKAIKQSWVDTYVDILDIFEVIITDTEPKDVLSREPVDGEVTILPIADAGRVIDVWMFDPKLGGRGLGEPANLVLPQMGLNLTAKVTYNWQPVSYKKVTFEIRGPFPHGEFETGKVWAVLQDDTCDDGHAYAFFRMPWTGHDPEELIGTWGVKVSVTLADVVITDYMEFDYDYLIHIWSVTTDKLEYYKSNDVEITVTYGTKSARYHNVTLWVTIQDELGVPIGIAGKGTTVGGGELCTYINFTDTVTIHVPRWAYAGLATVRASFVSGLPSEGGEAVAQELAINIWILPVHYDDPWLTDP